MAEIYCMEEGGNTLQLPTRRRRNQRGDVPEADCFERYALPRRWATFHSFRAEHPRPGLPIPMVTIEEDHPPEVEPPSLPTAQESDLQEEKQERHWMWTSQDNLEAEVLAKENPYMEVIEEEPVYSIENPNFQN